MRGASKLLMMPRRGAPAWVQPFAGLDLDVINNRSYFGNVEGDALSRFTITRNIAAAYYDVAGLLQFAAANVARLTYHPITHALQGLFTEDTATNYCLRSNEFNDAAWGTKTNVTITPASTTGPDGTLSATKIEATATATTNFSTNCPNAGSVNGNTFSVYIKRGNTDASASSFTLRNDTSATNLVGGNFNFATGVISGGLSAGMSAQQLPNGWWRLSLTASTGFAANDIARIYIGWSGGSGTAGDYLYVYGAQVERNTYASSYIPTLGAIVVRPIDLVGLPTSSFDFNPLAGTVRFEGIPWAYPTTGIFGTLWSLRANPPTDSERVEQYVRHSTGVSRLFIRNTGGTQSDQGDAVASAVTIGVSFKSAAAWIQDNAGISINGAAPITDTSVLLPTQQILYIGNSNVGGNSTGSTVYTRRLTYWPSRKSNTELQALAA